MFSWLKSRDADRSQSKEGGASASLNSTDCQEEQSGGEHESGDGSHNESVTRRGWLGTAIGAVISGGVAGIAGANSEAHASPSSHLRPPGALPKGEFESACARCLKCGSACPNGCIEYYGFEKGLKQAFTPYIKARERACILCGECTKVCPTGALQPFETHRNELFAGVKMGEARVNEGLCYSFHGRTCGACYRACPLAGQAIKIGVFETPHVDPEFCVGCGLCEQACLHLPQAIRVIPIDKIKPCKKILKQVGDGEKV